MPHQRPGRGLVLVKQKTVCDCAGNTGEQEGPCQPGLKRLEAPTGAALGKGLDKRQQPLSSPGPHQVASCPWGPVSLSQAVSSVRGISPEFMDLWEMVTHSGVCSREGDQYVPSCNKLIQAAWRATLKMSLRPDLGGAESDEHPSHVAASFLLSLKLP